MLRKEIICVNYLAKWLRYSAYSIFIEWKSFGSYCGDSDYYYYKLYAMNCSAPLLTGRD